MAIEEISIQSKEIERVLKFVGRLAKDMSFDSEMESRNWARARRKNNFLYSLLPVAKDVKIKKSKIGSIGVLSAKYDTPSDEHIIVYIHGGGFVTGSAYAKKNFCATLSKLSGSRVYAPEYSLAPEHKFPQGFNDCCEVVDGIIEKYPNAKISLIGESAGGNLCLGLGLKYKDSGKIASVSVHSPTVDFTYSVDRSINEINDFIVKPGSTGPLTRMYVGDADVKNPYVSPLLGDYTGFPPLFITCDANETLYADSLALYDKCEKARVNVQMIVATGAFHAFGVTGTSVPEMAEVLKRNIEFMKNSL